MDDAQIREILENTRTVAVLGLHDDPAKAAFYVPDYLARQGYRIRGVNPKLAGERRFGQTVVASLPEIDEAVDLVDVFRASAALPVHLPEVLAMEPRPKVVWLQLGIADDQFVTHLHEAGITVVQGRCALAEHRRLGIAAR